MSPYSAANPVRLPDPAARFAARASRLRRLAGGHPEEAWLRVIARIADGQRAAVREVDVPPVTPPADGTPLPFDRVALDPSWRRMLAIVLARADALELADELGPALARLGEASAHQLDGLARRLLADSRRPVELAAAPFVGAALQAWFAALAARLDLPALRVRGSACPACGAPPLAGLVDGATRRRYLACSLCGVEWNVPRPACVSCGCDGDLAYFDVAGDPGAKAEACSACNGYFKLFDLEARPDADPVADDVATRALDELAAGAGFERIGVSPFVMAGARSGAAGAPSPAHAHATGR